MPASRKSVLNINGMDFSLLVTAHFPDQAGRHPCPSPQPSIVGDPQAFGGGIWDTMRPHSTVPLSGPLITGCIYTRKGPFDDILGHLGRGPRGEYETIKQVVYGVFLCERMEQILHRQSGALTN